MLTLSLRNLLAHKARLALTVTAVTLGVAFVSGAFVLSDTMGKAFDQLFGSVAQGSDLAVRARTHGAAHTMPGQARPVDDSVVATVAGVPGVDAAEGSVTGYAVVLDKHGKPVGGDNGTLGSSLHTDRTLGTAYSIRAGHAPHGARQVALDIATATKAGYRVGDTVRLELESGPASFTLAGTIHVGPKNGSTLAGATMAAFDLPTAQHVLGRDGKVDNVDIRAAAGTDLDELRDRVSTALPAGVEAVTSRSVADESASAVRDNLSMFSTILVAFAAVSLLVGAFVIWNTFSVLVAQRRREVALLRAVGATRRQILTGLVVEATGIGLVSSLLGLAGGAGVAIGLLGLLEASGVDLPSTAPVLAVRTVIVALAVGLVITLAAAVVPAVAATRVAAVEALRDATPGSGSMSRRRRITGVALLTAGATALATAAASPDRGGLAGLGALLGFVGLVVAGPQLARALAGLVDRIAGRGRVGGWRMAARNVARTPQRAAATALALTIGLAVVAAATVVAASMKASVADAVTGGNRADLMLKPAGMMGALTPAVADHLQQNKTTLGLDAVAQMRFLTTTVYPAGPEAQTRAATTANVGGINPADTVRTIDLDFSSGSMKELRTGTVLLSAKQANKVDARVGDPVSVLFPETGRRTFTVGGIFDRDALIGAGYLLTLDDYEANVTSRLDAAVMVRFAGNRADAAAAKAHLTRSLRVFPNVTVKDQAEFVAEQQKHVDQMLGLVTAMLLLAVVIAVLGIVNTLVLSVLERTRELGLLRAVGGTRRQVRSVVRREAVLMAALGALSGAALGAGIGTAASRALDGQGITSLAVPVGSLVAYSVLATLVGIIAAVGPARRASRVDVLTAVTVE